MSMATSQRVWFITGASTGFGRLLAEQVLAKGDKVVATARKPEQIADLTHNHPEQALTLALDVTDRTMQSKLRSMPRSSSSAVSMCWSTMPATG